MGGVGFPPPKSPQYPVHSGGEILPASPSSLPHVLDKPRPGSYAVLPRLVMPSIMSAVTRQGSRLPNSVYPPPSSHIAPACAPPATQVPSPNYTPCTVPFLSAAPDMQVPLYSSVSHTPSPTESPSPGTGGRPCQRSFRHWSAGPPCRTGRPG